MCVVYVGEVFYWCVAKVCSQDCPSACAAGSEEELEYGVETVVSCLTKAAEAVAHACQVGRSEVCSAFGAQGGLVWPGVTEESGVVYSPHHLEGVDVLLDCEFFSELMDTEVEALCLRCFYAVLVSSYGLGAVYP